MLMFFGTFDHTLLFIMVWCRRYQRMTLAAEWSEVTWCKDSEDKTTK